MSALMALEARHMVACGMKRVSFASVKLIHKVVGG